MAPTGTQTTPAQRAITKALAEHVSCHAFIPDLEGAHCAWEGCRWRWRGSFFPAAWEAWVDHLEALDEDVALIAADLEPPDA